MENELEDGVSSLAVPLRDTDGQVVASINMADYFVRQNGQRLDSVALKSLVATAAEIEMDLRLMRGTAVTRYRPKTFLLFLVALVDRVRTQDCPVGLRVC